MVCRGRPQTGWWWAEWHRRGVGRGRCPGPPTCASTLNWIKTWPCHRAGSVSSTKPARDPSATLDREPRACETTGSRDSVAESDHRREESPRTQRSQEGGGRASKGRRPQEENRGGGIGDCSIHLGRRATLREGEESPRPGCPEPCGERP